ncbi:septal ring lytic transglycosylase RlpA family protein [Phyllobacterium phragmitis]|uniref:septal ring lytic transglycosylase RlpA family protein n=1 Tax=Phyllobacterium phragmitis TaxID=2670329 RepID=UPI003CCA4F43
MTAENHSLVRYWTKRFDLRVAGVVILGAFVAACATPQPKSKGKHRSKEYFAESEYGVKASPRVISSNVSKMPRGGGRDQVGKPYQVKGKWYYPKEEPGYKRVGKASWYGSAFHGRLTANGEVYDMRHLSAAHPTMPLPSYARVTNLSNGSSVIVRVNDRGPYAHGRVIDLSQRAAEMLDYKHHGTANVKVEYVGRAPLEGRDDAFLMASFRSGSDPIGQPASGVMIAMNGPTPTAAMPGARPSPAVLPAMASAAAMPQKNVLQPPSPPGVLDGLGAGDPVLPAIGPIVTERPGISMGIAHVPGAAVTSTLAGYADARIAAANGVEAMAYASVLTPSAISDAWKKLGADNANAVSTEYVDAGFFGDKSEADRIAVALSAYGKVRRTHVPTENGELYGVTVVGSSDSLLKAAWAAGAADAFVVRAQ